MGCSSSKPIGTSSKPDLYIVYVDKMALVAFASAYAAFNIIFAIKVVSSHYKVKFMLLNILLT